jgi:hypothetical protein
MAFKGCTSLAWVKWHESAADATITGASSTANGAFNGCTALTKVELPDGLTNIGNRTFQGCTAVLFYILNGTTPPTIAANTFAGSGSYPIYVPDGAVSTYKGTSVWSTATYTSKITSVNSLPSQDEPSNW